MLTANRLVDLEQTVESLNGELRKIKCELYRAKAEPPLPARLWRNLMNRKGGQEFMSAVCNRRARPNTKMVSYADTRS
jgi:hypothetical protein